MSQEPNPASFTPPGAPGPSLGHNSSVNVAQLPIAGLSQAPGDPRVFSRSDIDKAVAIVRRHGMPMPIAVDAEGHVLSGWQAVLAARRLGLETLPAIQLDHFAGPPARQLSLALNRFLELGSFDRRTLGKLILDLEVAIPDFSVVDVGLDITEADLAIASLDEDDATNELPPPGPAVTASGDLWLMGAHRVAQGDATKAAVVEALVGDQSCAAMITDPPYGCKIGGFVTTRNHREFVQASGELGDEALGEFFRGFCAAAKPRLRPGAGIYLFIDWRSLWLLLSQSREIYGRLINMLVWYKDRPAQGSLYRSQMELILVHAAPGGKIKGNIKLGSTGRHRSNVLQYPSAHTFSRSGPEGDLLASHPTPKPLNLIADLILDCTARDEVVLDPFLGSATTLIAAEKTGRICYGLDLDPLYVDLAVRRWQSWTGRDAIHAVSGRTFASLQAEIGSGPDGH